MTAALKAITGSAGAPSISFTADATTGLYYVSANGLGLSSNGLNALTLNADQVAAFSQSAYAKTFVILDTADATTSSNLVSLATASTGAIAVGSTTNWATNGYLLANNEIMSYTVASAAGLTINARGIMGTTGATHATGATITMLYGGLSKDNLLVPSRATAARTPSPAAGDMGLNTGSGVIEYYNGSVWVNSAAPQLVPQGYLTPTSITPVVTGDVTSAGTIYYTPFNGNQIPIPVAGVFSLTTFSETAITLSASQAVSNLYDVYAFTSGGALNFGLSVSWANGGGSVTPGSCARGTTTALVRANGLFINNTQQTFLNGASSSTVATGSGLYLGTIYINPATAGTVNLHRTFGQNRQWGIWNAFNKVPLYLKAGESTASWNYATGGTFRVSNATTANNLTVLSGLAEEPYTFSFDQMIAGAGGTNPVGLTGIGINSQATATGVQGGGNVLNNANIFATLYAKYISPPLLGINTIYPLEAVVTGTTVIFKGTESYQTLFAQWRG